MEVELVSVIMPVYNAGSHVLEAIESVLIQSYQSLEIIIVDDASTDDSLVRVNSFTDKRIKCISLDSNVGAGKARNKGIAAANGRYIAFIDADDKWMEDKLSQQIQFMKKENVALSYTDYYLMNEDSDYTHRVFSPSQLNLQMMKRNNYIGCLTAVYDAKVLGKVYMPERRKRQDWALWLKILQKIDYTAGLGKPLSAYRQTENSLSRNKLGLLAENYRFYREVLKYNAFRSSVCLLRFLWAYTWYKMTSVKSID